MFVEKKFFIGVNDVDLGLNITNKSILKYLEEIAGIHSNMAGYGLYDIPATHKTWIALGWKVQINRRPKYTEEMHIRTWCKDDKKLYSYRDFEVKDQTGKVIILATSKWVLIDTESRNILKISDEVNTSYELENINVFEEINQFKFKEPLEKQKVREIVIDESLIDYNNHVHNTDYIQIAEKSLPETIKKDFSNFEIMYKKEMKFNDKINIYYSTTEDEQSIVTLKSQDDKLLHSIVKFY